MNPTEQARVPPKRRRRDRDRFQVRDQAEAGLVRQRRRCCCDYRLRSAMRGTLNSVDRSDRVRRCERVMHRYSGERRRSAAFVTIRKRSNRTALAWSERIRARRRSRLPARRRRVLGRVRLRSEAAHQGQGRVMRLAAATARARGSSYRRAASRSSCGAGRAPRPYPDLRRSACRRSGPPSTRSCRARWRRRGARAS